MGGPLSKRIIVPMDEELDRRLKAMAVKMSVKRGQPIPVSQAVREAIVELADRLDAEEHE